jgi:uncharacterized protein YqgC (DUF456 family)
MPDHRLDIGWVVVIVVLGLAILGEIIEFLAGAAGVAQTGGSRRGAVLALVGSVMGGILGIFVGLPIPLIGSMLAALLFGGLGALAGAMIGETWAGRNLEDSLRVGHGAFWGRLLGTLGKILLGSVMIAVVIAAIVFRF